MCSRESDAINTAGHMLADITWSVLRKTTEKLIIESIPVQGLRAVRDFLCEGRAIFSGNYTPRAQLDALREALERLHNELTRYRGEDAGACCRYLQTVISWLR
ncbi:hypothetical protein ACGVWS_06985, partial [Enterobacteriaceae bacterium LUAb1]